jgi:site-specific DNA-cytosine methylase
MNGQMELVFEPKRKMNVLIACEESQRVCKAFREKGHSAFSCDIQECSGGHPEWHIKGDVLPLLNGNCIFVTQSGELCAITQRWDLIIAHPPCTYFSNATMVNLGRKDKPHIFNDKWKQDFLKKRQNALDFVKVIYNAECEKICIENVVGYLSNNFKKPSQYIEPYYFGEPWRKKTCLWLKGLPLLMPTEMVDPTGKWVRHHLKTKNDLNGYKKAGVYSAKERSKTFVGVAKAMAEQWG